MKGAHMSYTGRYACDLVPVHRKFLEIFQFPEILRQRVDVVGMQVEELKGYTGQDPRERQHVSK